MTLAMLRNGTRDGASIFGAVDPEVRSDGRRTSAIGDLGTADAG